MSVVDESPGPDAGVTELKAGVTELKAGVTELKAGVTDIKAHVMILSLKIDAMESLLTDQYTEGSVRDVICDTSLSAGGTYPMDPVCRQFVEDLDDSYQDPIHELKDILRRGKPPKGKPRWK
jgi:X-X-X-Leu-X-X-Gly heptad repeat protein